MIDRHTRRASLEHTPQSSAVNDSKVCAQTYCSLACYDNVLYRHTQINCHTSQIRRVRKRLAMS
jgi:hypothetical protein